MLPNPQHQNNFGKQGNNLENFTGKDVDVLIIKFDTFCRDAQ